MRCRRRANDNAQESCCLTYGHCKGERDDALSAWRLANARLRLARPQAHVEVDGATRACESERSRASGRCSLVNVDHGVVLLAANVSPIEGLRGGFPPPTSVHRFSRAITTQDGGWQ
ncbi:hypothetical protein SORBI_3004G056350 [Sorghum bicolor]|uniref:Uncharacterized protein n=1 Tax=Sorghum bicolor TaxID=4558 RepID=A0A1Z5RL43_SORBI|nr:hypothetical protein SORBI_3004G056350 [Sorghum bicolor]